MVDVSTDTQLTRMVKNWLFDRVAFQLKLFNQKVSASKSNKRGQLLYIIRCIAVVPQKANAYRDQIFRSAFNADDLTGWCMGHSYDLSAETSKLSKLRHLDLSLHSCNPTTTSNTTTSPTSIIITFALYKSLL